jgi:hypothetical protein
MRLRGDGGHPEVVVSCVKTKGVVVVNFLQLVDIKLFLKLSGHCVWGEGKVQAKEGLLSGCPFGAAHRTPKGHNAWLVFVGRVASPNGGILHAWKGVFTVASKISVTKSPSSMPVT